jgi:multiple sugar transport system substrate-binding protein
MKNRSFLKITFLMICVGIIFLCASSALSQEKIALTFWHHEPPAHRVKAFQTVIDKFVEKNPNIQITQEVVTWDDVWAKTLAAISMGTTPDFQFDLPELNISAYVAGGILSVDDLVKEIDEKQGFFKSVLDPYYHDGHYWGVPVWHIPFALIYRPSLFEKYLGTNQPPKNWTELLDYAAKLTVDTNGDGNADLFGMGVVAGKTLCTAEQIWPFLAQTGATLFDEKGNVNFNSPNSVKAVQMYKDLFKYAPPAATGWAWGELEMNFSAGNIAMMPYFGSVLKAFYESKNKDLASVALPYPEDGQKGTLVYPSAIMVFKSAEKKGHLDAVKSFIRFMMDPENNYLLTAVQEPGLYLPATRANLEASNFWDHGPIAEYKDFVQPLADAAKYGSLFGFTYGANNLAIGAISGELVLADLVQKAVIEGLSAEEAVKWANGKMEKLSSENK